MKNMRGMTLQLLRLIMQAAIVSILMMVLVIQISNVLISQHFTRSDLQQQMAAHRVEKLADYVAEHDIVATDHIRLQNWCDKQPLVLMEVYRDNHLLFNSNYTEETALSEQNIEVPHYDWYSYYMITFADGEAELLIYSDESYVLQNMAKLLALLLAVILFLAITLHGIKDIIQYIYLLTDEISVMGNGDLEHPITIKGENELTLLAAGLEHTRQSLVDHRQNEEAMIKQNRDMITGLSHDLRTPLTKIMLCTEILQSGKYHDEAEFREYLTRTYNNSLQLKAISEHILQYALSHDTFSDLKKRTIGYRQAFDDVLSEMADYFMGLGLETEWLIEWYDEEIEVIDLNVRRVLDNIVSNIEKYTDREASVTIYSVRKEGYAGFGFKNKKMITNNLEGHHVGLNNLQTLMAEMHGFCEIKEDTDFDLRIYFHLADSHKGDLPKISR